MRRKVARREFLKQGVLGAAASGLAAGQASALEGPAAPSDRVVLALIGAGRQGMGLLKAFGEQKDARLAAVCDVYAPHREKAREASGAEACADFRRVLDRPDIDAVVVATPDHWHPLMTVMACQAGKDVYVEKPVSVAVGEGRKMVEAAGKHRRVVQVGTQQRSGVHFQHAVEIVRSGRLGKVTLVRTWNVDNSFPEGIGNPPDSAPPPDLDWEMWLGPAPRVPFNSNRFGVRPDAWSSFRWFWDYAGGMMTDWGVHLLDIVQWAMDAEAPRAVWASGGKLALQDNRETPDTLTVSFEYPGFVAVYENRVCNGRPFDGHGYGITFHGSEATLFVDREGFELIPEWGSEGPRRTTRTDALREGSSNPQVATHVRNFLDCVKSRERPVSDVEVGHRSTTTCLLANIAYRTGRKVHWDAAREQVQDDPGAAAYLRREYRPPWKLEV